MNDLVGIILLLVCLCLIVVFLHHLNTRWRKKCYYCGAKLTSKSFANFKWIINGSSAAVCNLCEEHAREQAYGSKILESKKSKSK
jgi:hypothetical protein